jgi:hypothetical protein
VKYKAILISGLILFLASAQVDAAANFFKTSAFKVILYVNNNRIPFDDRNPILNVNGKAYVPLRALSEITGNIASYHEKSRSIFINHLPTSPVQSDQHQETANEDFSLKIASDKTSYKVGETIRVWTRLVRIGEQPITIYHGEPLVGFTIKDSDGDESDLIWAYSLNTSTFESGDEYIQSLLPQYILSYRSKESEAADFDQYLQHTEYPISLLQGEYTITAIASYSTNPSDIIDSKKRIEASITIHVE